MTRLNLASGTDLRPFPWVNLDIVPHWPGCQRGCDVVWDARKDPIPFPDGSVEEVYAGYLLLHLAPRFHAPVLAEIRRVCGPSARVVFGEVDMEAVMRRWLLDPHDARCAELIWGEQGNVDSSAGFDEFDKHCHGFCESSLRQVLAEAGFQVQERIWLHQVFSDLTLLCTKT